MAIKLAINGFGRIGRNICRALFESGQSADFDLVAINDLGDTRVNAHLLQHDTAHGRFSKEVAIDGDYMTVDGDRMKVLSERDPSKLPWKELDVDVVLECTGFFTSKEKAAAHLAGGAKKVLISAPAGSDLKTIVYGVNHHILSASDTIVSNASCTTNCLAPLIKILNDKIGVNHGIMTTVHAYTNDQVLTDTYHRDMHRARSATHNMIPTKTGAAASVGLVLPEFVGKLDGFSVRVPTINVSLVDLTFSAKRKTSVEEINAIMLEASQGEFKGILGYNNIPLVSSDFNHNPASSTYDEAMTRIINDDFVKVCSWYDNEWGFSNRMLDTTKALMNAK